jgi:S1-C subfamily serine protease
MRRFACVVALALVSCAAPARDDPRATLDDRYSAFYQRLHPSTVLFTMQIPADDPKRKGEWDDAYGSGVIVASGAWGSRILTAAHVVADARNVRATVGDHSRPVPVRLVAKSNDDDDLALLDIAIPALPAAPFARAADVVPGLPVGLLGYPIPDAFEDEHLQRTVSLYTGHVASVRNGTIELDAPVIPGESGGPVFDAVTGGVIGIAESRFDEERAIGFATPLTIIDRFLTTHRTQPIFLDQ